jgi:hypothetical protein
MGLEKISKLTTSAIFKLRLTMKKFSGETIIETYSTFTVANQVISKILPIQQFTLLQIRLDVNFPEKHVLY